MITTRYYASQIDGYGLRAGEIYRAELIENGARRYTAIYGAGVVELSAVDLHNLVTARDMIRVMPIKRRSDGAIHFYALAYGLAVWIRGEDYEAVRPSRALDEYSPVKL